MTPNRVGFIGLGAMGLPMAKNVLDNGYEIHITAHRNREPVEELKKQGAIEQDSVKDVISQADTIITILPTDNEMEKVLLSEEVINELSPEKLLIEMTSGSPAMIKKINERYTQKGVSVLDAPVSGGTPGAQNGTLTVMGGGNEETLALSRPVLETMASNISLVGEIGAGKAIKAINQMLASVHMVISAEAVALAENLNIDMQKMKEVIGTSSGSSWMLMNKMENLSKRDFDPGFKLRLMKKDLQIAVNEGSEQYLPVAKEVLELYKAAEEEMGDLDFSAISKNILT